MPLTNASMSAPTTTVLIYTCYTPTLSLVMMRWDSGLEKADVDAGSRRCSLRLHLVGSQCQVSLLPSTTSANGRPLLFGCLAGTTRLYDSPLPCMWDLYALAFSHRPAAFPPRATTGPLGSRAWSIYACVGSWTPQGDVVLALSHTALLPSG